MYHQKIFSAIFLGLFASGCATAHKPATAEIMDNSRSNTSSVASVTILFGTDRVPAAGTIVQFTTVQGGLTYGTCEVKIPPIHCRSEIEKPQWCKLEFGTDANRHFLLNRVSIMTPDEFALRLSGGTEGETFLFVHGFNVSFKDAAYTTAQIAYDLRLDRQPLLYSWASRENPALYKSDETNAQNTLPRFKDFLRTVLKTKSLKKIHLIAHSMGTRVLTETLKALKEEGGSTARIGQVVLLAPDIDSQYFQEQLFGAIRDIGEGFTVYGSSKDLALQASSAVAGGLPRLGQGGDKLTVMSGMTTIDASFCSDNCTLCHTLSGIPCVLNDLFLFINRGLAPMERLMDSKQSTVNRQIFFQLYDTNCRN